jgi:16S rRNA (uracil1498-N3)-methyltransferase
VIAITPDEVMVRFAASGPAPAPIAVDLVVAVPRPKVLRRVLQAVAAIGVRRVDLVNAWRVEKSYLGSARLAADAIALDLRLGAEQGGTTWLPEVAVHPRLMGYLDERMSASRWRLCAHARGGAPIEDALAPGAAGDVALAIGPEGGWIEREVETFAARGWHIVSLGAPILRVEAAVVSALAQVALLQRLRAP